MTSLVEILKIDGPLMSSDLAKLFAGKNKIAINAASQRVSRSKDIIQIKGFFKSNQSFCYLEEHLNTISLLDEFSGKLAEYGKKYWFTLNALKMHEGIVSRKYLECYTNYPIEPLKKHIPFEEVMQKFVSERILVLNGNEYVISTLIYSQIPNALVHKTIELIKDSVLNNFHSLTKNTGLISFETGKLFGEFGKLRWGFTGVSYVHGIRKNGKPGFLLADILIGKSFYKNDVQFFVEKIKTVQSFNNAPNLIPFLIVDDIEKEALNYLKSQGIVIGFIKELFGEKYASALRELISILNNAGASLKSTPDKYLELISELKKYNYGLLNNIKGTLFEFAVGHLHVKSCKSIDIGRVILANGGRHEMDVLADYGNKVIIAECKATKSLVDENMIDYWLKIKIPAFRKWLLNQETLKEKELHFEYWSTSGFTEGAMNTLNSMVNSLSTKYTLSYFGAKEIREQAKIRGDKKMKEIFDTYFLNSEV
jgi:hypothetical protein